MIPLGLQLKQQCHAIVGGPLQRLTLPKRHSNSMFGAVLGVLRHMSGYGELFKRACV
jgi:hypothetical protein